MKQVHILFILVISLIQGCDTAVAQDQATFNWSVSPAKEWDALFDRKRGWAGADGIYSFNSSGYDQRNSAYSTYFFFGDTFVGNVNGIVRQPGTRLIRNSMAILKGRYPKKDKISFSWGEMGRRNNAPLFAPESAPNEFSNWFWPNDGVVVGNKLFLYAIRMTNTATGGGFGFAVSDVKMIELTLGQGNPLAYEKQYDTPLYSPANAVRGDQYLGHAVMANTTQAGAPFPDGYIYIYGPQNNWLNKSIIAGRVLPRQITDFGAYTFWNGSEWVSDLEQATPITDKMSSEFSMTPLADGRFLTVFQRDSLSANVAYRICDTPVGPCSEYEDIYTCPQAAQGMLCYNAKAHPNLSKPGKLLISYNVNVGLDGLQDNMSNADIYRPRFIWLNYDLGMTN